MLVLPPSGAAMQQSTVTIVAEELLSDNWYILKKITFEGTTGNGSAARQTREVHDRGNGAKAKRLPCLESVTTLRLR